MNAIWKWVLFVITPNVYPDRWQDRLFVGHVRFNLFWLLPVTIYGANAMHWAINVWFRGTYWCFHPPTRTFGGNWPWYFYISPDATPWAATFHRHGHNRPTKRGRNLAAALAVLLASSVAMADPPADAPLADPDAQGRTMKLEAGEIAPFAGVLLDAQEDVHRERSRVRAEVGEREWKTIAYASIGAGAVVTVTLVLLTGLAAAHKL